MDPNRNGPIGVFQIEIDGTVRVFDIEIEGPTGMSLLGCL